MDVRSVARQGLCISCGTCVAVCPEKCTSLVNDDDSGLLVPTLEESSCTQCSLCYKVCPGIHADYSPFLESSGSEGDRNSASWPVGPYKHAFVGSAQDDHIQYNGASGGALSQVLLYMLERSLIDGAVTTRMGALPKSVARQGHCTNEMLFAAPVLCRTRQEIVAAQKSKYCPVPVCELLEELIQTPGRFAIVGLPCHLLAIRRMQAINPVLRGKARYLLALFCSRTPNFHATTHLLRREGINIDDVARLEYRAGGQNIGYMEVTLKGGRVHRVPHLSYNYWGRMFRDFYMPHRCYLCPDKLGAIGDISFGDNWTHQHDDSPGGSSTVMIRTEKGRAVIDGMTAEGKLTRHPITETMLVDSQRLKKKGNLYPRIRICKALRYATPDYGQIDIRPMYSLGTLDWVRTGALLLQSRLSASYQNYSLVSWWGRANDRLTRMMPTIRNMLPYARRLWRLATCFLPSSGPAVVKRRKFKITMMGGYGAKDIGDEAMPRADILKFQEILGDTVEFVMLSGNPEFTAFYHGQRSVSDPAALGFVHRTTKGSVKHNTAAFARGILLLVGALMGRCRVRPRLVGNLRPVLDELMSSDVLFNVGGGNLNSLIPYELYKKGFLYLAAKMLRKPTVVSGQTIGPLDNAVDRFFAALALNRVHLITFRDKEVSHRRCLDVGITRPVMKDAADDAISLPSCPRHRSEGVLRREFGEEWFAVDRKITVCMNLKSNLRTKIVAGKDVDLSPIVKTYGALADRILDNYSAKILFLPTYYRPGSDDTMLHKQIISYMRNAAGVFCLDSEEEDTVLKGIIGLSDLAMGARYHFCVFAAAECVPFLGMASGVYQMTKLQGLANLCHLPDLYWQKDLLESGVDELWNRVRGIINDLAQIRDSLSEIVPGLIEKSRYSIDFAVNRMMQKSRMG